MDSSNNLVPGIDPNELAAAAAAEANTVPEANPAADVANAAMAGAEPVVTTTDETASDVAPEPTLQMPTPEVAAPEAPAAEAPADDGPVSLAPSADFQMGEVSTVSAVQNGADGNLAAANDEIMIGQPLEQPAQDLSQPAESTAENPMDDPNVDQLANTEMGEQSTGQEAADFNDPEAAAAAEAAAKTSKEDEEDQEPIVAAAPVPGSIGSAKSYADIQRAEAEKAAKVAAKQNAKVKLSKNTIMIIAIAAVVVIGIVFGIIMMVGGGGSSTPTRTNSPAPVSGGDDDGDHDLSTLSCKRPLAHEEYDSYAANSGTYENIFYFKDDTLDGLVTNFSYSYDSLQTAKAYRDQFMQSLGLTEEERAGKDNEKSNKESEEPSTDGESETGSETASEKTPDQMLKHYIYLDKMTVIHGMEIKSEDIEAWLKSDAYSDRTYGATDKPNSEETTEPTRNLDYYKTLQNSIDFTCEITKGY